MRQGEDDMVVARRQELVLARLDPALLGQGLTLGAVAVAAGVVAVDQAAAAITGLELAAQRRRPAGHDLGHHPGLLGRGPMTRSVRLTEAPEDLREL